MADLESNRRFRSRRSRQDIEATLDRIRTGVRPALRRDYAALAQITNQLDLFSQMVQNIKVEQESVDAGIHRMENVIRRSVEGNAKVLGLILSSVKLLKDQLTGFARDHH